MVSWDDCQGFMEKLNAKFGKQGGKFLLPSEAQWEYACRAGSTGEFYFGDDVAKLGEYAWYDANSGKTEHLVGEKKPNASGLYDMHGNAWQWCSDYYSADYYAKSPVDDPQGPGVGHDRVNRGGSCAGAPYLARSAKRNRNTPDNRNNNTGFRVANTTVRSGATGTCESRAIYGSHGRAAV